MVASLRWRYSIALLLVHAAALTMISSPPACPPECICLSQTQVLCNSGGLSEIPVKLLPATVEQLSLTRNHFPLIRSEAFAGLRALRKLSLDGNNITTIKPFAFRGLPRLQEISIQQTPLASVPSFAFAGLQNLTAIQLGHNRIRAVETYAFAGTTSLQQLVLAGNPLVTLEANAFSGLSTVERIVLPSGIRVVEPDAFNGLDTVGYLKLAYMDLGGVRNGTFRGLSQVGALSIQESDLGTIRAGAFDGVAHVRALSVLNNKVDAIQELLIAADQHVHTLRLQGNHILDVPRPDAVQVAVVRLVVVGNHFPCDCHIHALLAGAMTNDSVAEFAHRNFCISPMELNGRPISELDLDAIGRCEDEVTRGNLESPNDLVASGSSPAAHVCVLLLLSSCLRLLRCPS